jgi:hypothetical protein
MTATEWVMSPAARRAGDMRGSADESHEPWMNWIDSFGVGVHGVMEIPSSTPPSEPATIASSATRRQEA